MSFLINLITPIINYITHAPLLAKHNTNVIKNYVGLIGDQNKAYNYSNLHTRKPVFDYILDKESYKLDKKVR